MEADMNGRGTPVAALTVAVLSLGTIGLAAPPDKPPDNVVVVNPSPLAVSVANSPLVQIDPSANVTRSAVPTPMLATVARTNIPNGTGCGPVSVSLPTGVPVALRRANVAFTFATPEDLPRADVRILVKTGPADSAEVAVAIPLGARDAFDFANGAAALDGYVVKGNSFAAAAVGDAYAVNFCLNRGSGQIFAFAWVTLAGTRTP
jgi:hypothetical protein